MNYNISAQDHTVLPFPAVSLSVYQMSERLEPSEWDHEQKKLQPVVISRKRLESAKSEGALFDARIWPTPVDRALEEKRMMLMKLECKIAKMPLEETLKACTKVVTTRDWNTALRERRMYKTLSDISEMKAQGKWSFQQYKRQNCPPRQKTHWDYLLDEMKWMHFDFVEENKYKRAVCSYLSNEIKKKFGFEAMECTSEPFVCEYPASQLSDPRIYVDPIESFCVAPLSKFMYFLPREAKQSTKMEMVSSKEPMNARKKLGPQFEKRNEIYLPQSGGYLKEEFSAEEDSIILRFASMYAYNFELLADSLNSFCRKNRGKRSALEIYHRYFALSDMGENTTSPHSKESRKERRTKHIALCETIRRIVKLKEKDRPGNPNLDHVIRRPIQPALRLPETEYRTPLEISLSKWQDDEKNRRESHLRDCNNQYQMGTLMSFPINRFNNFQPHYSQPIVVKQRKRPRNYEEHFEPKYYPISPKEEIKPSSEEDTEPKKRKRNTRKIEDETKNDSNLRRSTRKRQK